MSRRKQLRPFKVQDDDDDSNANQIKNADNGLSTASNGHNNTTEPHASNQNCDTAKDGGEEAEVIEKCSESNAVISSSENRTERKGVHQNSANNDGNQSDDAGKTDSESTSQEHVTFDALENTKVAMAQFAAAALSKGANENSVKDLTMLQSALFTLQHQQVFQMQLIEQLQYQLAKNSVKRDKKHSTFSQDDPKNDERENASDKQAGISEEPFDDDDVFVKNSEERTDTPKPETKEEIKVQDENPESKNESKIDEVENQVLESDCNISSTLASNIITNHDSSPPSNGTNSLELLQKRAEEVLDSASQSFTTGSLIDELSYRTGAFFNDGPSDDPALKHRCRYCGKIFGSDSALQIHLRSHTGERPFICRVCGSRFTTKGNLKVHYQRHTETMEFTDKSKKEPRAPYDFRTQNTQTKSKSLTDETFDANQKKGEEKEEFYNDLNESRDSPESESPKRFDEDGARHFLNFDQEYSSSKKKAWEKYMEIVDTPKAYELQQDEAYRVDPNKCPICNRLLSCRSALRQHYRTHTGERPFRCRLCARSFTTKGNLKTHIGVHKINPLLNPVHSCTMCHKKYSTSQALQQHINTHTGAPIEMTIDQIRAAEVREFVSHDSLNDLYGSNSSLGDYNETRDSSLDFEASHNKSEIEYRNKVALVVELSDSEDSKSRPKRASQDFEKEIEKLRKNFNYSDSPEPKRRCSEADKPIKTESTRERGMDFFTKFPPMFGSASVPLSSPSLLPGNINSLLATNSFASVGFSTGVRGNTTCNICFKTLACHSALEIHYRSHTKEKPYLCQLCNRGFSTKGNMKQHMLTHKIRDMPQHMFRNSTQSPSSDSNNSLSASVGFQSQQQQQQQQQADQQPAETALNLDDTVNEDRQLRASHTKDNDFDKNASAVSVADQSNPTYLSSDDSGSMSSPIRMKNGESDTGDGGGGGDNSRVIVDDNDEIKSDTFSSASGNIPLKALTKSETDCNKITSRKTRIKDSNRDYCKLCNKHFGSFSALETHIRSHTGAKPFTCTVCEKSFSTKGNLKVHMQAHSWPHEPNRNNRISLDLPNHFPPMSPYGLHRPSDLFNPFIANAAALQQKLHEANLYQKYASNMREFTADILKNNDEQTLHRNLFGLAHLPFQMFNDHIDHGSMKNK